MRLHNFYVFKDAIRNVTELIYGHDYILEQAVDREVYKVLKSIDEMVKSDDPTKVFEKYKQVGFDVSKNLKLMAQYRGIQANCEYAEGFHMIKKVENDY